MASLRTSSIWLDTPPSPPSPPSLAPRKEGEAGLETEQQREQEQERQQEQEQEEEKEQEIEIEKSLACALRSMLSIDIFSMGCWKQRADSFYAWTASLRGLHPGHQLPFPEKPPGIFSGFVWMCHFRLPNALPNAKYRPASFSPPFQGLAENQGSLIWCIAAMMKNLRVGHWSLWPLRIRLDGNRTKLRCNIKHLTAFNCI